jgi:hypothetical protein
MSPSKILAPFIALLIGAGCGGTGTGNPTGTANTNSYSLNTAEKIRTAICAKLTTCFASLDSNACATGVSVQTNLSAPLGLAASFGTLQYIIEAEAAGTILANPTIESICLDDLGVLGCASSQVQSSYNPSTAADFSHIVQLIPTSCSSLY